MATTYLEGHIKRDPSTGGVAIRTIFPDDDPVTGSQAWLMATVNRGAHFLTSTSVELWDDLYVPTPPAPPA